jgi:hypothetical protein
MEFMHRVRKRALDLTEYAGIFVIQGEERQRDSVSAPMVVFPKFIKGTK